MSTLLDKLQQKRDEVLSALKEARKSAYDNTECLSCLDRIEALLRDESKLTLLEQINEKHAKVRVLAQELREVLESPNLDWEVKYDAIFDAHQKKVKPALEEANLSLDYCDPDTSYEEDARAYVDALESLCLDGKTMWHW